MFQLGDLGALTAQGGPRLQDIAPIERTRVLSHLTSDQQRLGLRMKSDTWEFAAGDRVEFASPKALLGCAGPPVLAELVDLLVLLVPSGVHRGDLRRAA